MGGSGGGFFDAKTDPEQLYRRLRDSESRTRDEQFETEVGGIIGSLLAEYNDRPVDAIRSHLETIGKALESDIEGTIDLLYGGSVAKHTYVDGLSDVDSLVLLGGSELESMSPEEVRDYFYARLNERLPGSKIEKGMLAVTVKFKDIEIQLLPAIRSGSALRIASSTGKEWSIIRPQEFTKVLAEVNKDAGDKVVPVIKLAKSIVSDLPDDRALTGYHLEALAVAAFQDYEGPFNPKTMLTHFFLKASDRVLKPIVDVTGQSTHVDDYLGAEGSVQRRVIADSLNRMGRRMQNADGAQSVRQWGDILGVTE